jgi:hypothetical protein
MKDCVGYGNTRIAVFKHRPRRATAQTVSRWPLTTETLVLVSQCGIYGRQSSTGTDFSPHSSVFPWQCHFTVALHTNTSSWDEQQTCCGCSSEAQYHPMVMNNNNNNKLWATKHWLITSTYLISGEWHGTHQTGGSIGRKAFWTSQELKYFSVSAGNQNAVFHCH